MKANIYIVGSLIQGGHKTFAFTKRLMNTFMGRIKIYSVGLFAHKCIDTIYNVLPRVNCTNEGGVGGLFLNINDKKIPNPKIWIGYLFLSILIYGNQIPLPLIIGTLVLRYI